MLNSDLNFLIELESIILKRMQAGSDDSYTFRLASSGDKRMAQKVGEEAVELALAATSGDRDEQLNEAADLIYHLLVLLSSKEISIAEVTATLKERHISA